MKKYLLFVAIFIGTGRLMAQNATIAPFDKTLNGNINQIFKPDSNWRTLPPAILNVKLLKPQDLDLSKTAIQKQLNTQLHANAAYNMPVAKLEGYSKMPVKKLEGHSNMPVIGHDANKVKTLATIIP